MTDEKEWTPQERAEIDGLSREIPVPADSLELTVAALHSQGLIGGHNRWYHRNAVAVRIAAALLLFAAGTVVGRSWPGANRPTDASPATTVARSNSSSMSDTTRLLFF